MSEENNVALMLYGRGGELGNFRAFSAGLEQQLKKDYPKGRFIDLLVQYRLDFFGILANPPFQHKIGELHIFAHSVGAGVFFGYHDPSREDDRLEQRRRAHARGSPLNYNEVLAIEDGTVFTDDLVRMPFAALRDRIREHFADGAFIKLWGCNAGVEGWVYSDDDLVPGDPNRTLHYYWNALNEQNVPKPSIAQAFADFFDRPTYAATSGSHIEVHTSSGWMKSSAFRRLAGHRGNRELRLEPDQGSYREYLPSP